MGIREDLIRTQRLFSESAIGTGQPPKPIELFMSRAKYERAKSLGLMEGSGFVVFVSTGDGDFERVEEPSSNSPGGNAPNDLHAKPAKGQATT